MSRRTYSDEEKAAVYVAWITNDRVMKRTARSTGIPEGTLRKWIIEWNENGPPNEQAELIGELAGEFVEAATTVRDEALTFLRAKLPRAKVSELVATVGMLTDKVNMARGLATSRTEHVTALPPAEEVAQVLGTALQQALQAAQARDGDIIDVEVVETPALPAAK